MSGSSLSPSGPGCHQDDGHPHPVPDVNARCRHGRARQAGVSHAAPHRRRRAGESHQQAQDLSRGEGVCRPPPPLPRGAASPSGGRCGRCHVPDAKGMMWGWGADVSVGGALSSPNDGRGMWGGRQASCALGVLLFASCTGLSWWEVRLWRARSLDERQRAHVHSRFLLWTATGWHAVLLRAFSLASWCGAPRPICIHIILGAAPYTLW